MHPREHERLAHSPIYEFNSDGFYLGAGEMPEIRKKITERKYSIKLAKSFLSYREIHNWDSQGLLFDSRDGSKSGWRKFSMSDLLWLKILKILRDYGLSIEKLKKAYQCVQYIGTDTNSPRDILAHPVYLCSTNCPIYVVVYSDGWLEPISWADLNYNLAENILSANSYITINLNQCLSEIFPEEDFSYQIKFGLEEQEIKVLEAIRNTEENTEVAIHVKNSKVTSIEGKLKKELQCKNLGDFLSEPPWGKPHGIKSGVARVQAALAPYLLYPASLCNFE